ncbi:MAG TPA: pyridoxal-phosphate dependent enzyme [Acidimicrobiales bacterium]|jgi:D-cysteine desulfhydrase|nr:pyridoxal-phosphate dependent enzyme [Acidimicrobiales bacterium]
MTPGSRFPLGIEPTPLMPSVRLGDVLGVEVWWKRDDLIGFAQAGTKTRPLEFLVADALDGGYDCLVACGGPSSNFIAAVAAAAAVAHLDCHVVLFGTPPRSAHPNLGAARAWGAQLHFTGDPDRESIDAEAARHGSRLAAQGRRPYVLPRGGATAVGALGCAVAVRELDGPLRGEAPSRIVVAAGSGTTTAGLLVGLALLGWTTTIVAAAVSRPVAETRTVILRLAGLCCRRLGIPDPNPAKLEVIDALGPGFGIPGPEDTAAADLALRTEGIVLDPTYTAKAFAVLVDRASHERRGDGVTVFWHTGGIAGALASLEGRDGRAPAAGGPATPTAASATAR